MIKNGRPCALPRTPQALHRRGTARRNLGHNMFGAAQDFEAALRLEPGNSVLAKERDAAVAAHLTAAHLQMPSRRTRLGVGVKVGAQARVGEGPGGF